MKKLALSALMTVMFASLAMAEKSDRYCIEMADLGELIMKYHQYEEVTEAEAKALTKFSIQHTALKAYPESTDDAMWLIEKIYKFKLYSTKPQKDRAILMTGRNVFNECKTTW